MSGFWKKVIALFLVFCMVAAGIWQFERIKKESLNVSKQTSSVTELNVWYTDEALTPYMEEVKSIYQNDKGITLHLKQVSSMDYTEAINKETLKGINIPDVYIASNANLKMLYLGGLATETSDFAYADATYPKVAVDAVTYDGKIVAYPFYYETSFLLYNKKYCSSAPKTIDEIKAFAENFEAKDRVENIIKWDVADVFNNYFVIGNYASLNEGNNGKTVIGNQNINQISECLKYYQGLNQVFPIDLKTVTYENTLQDFFAGKSVFTIAQTDVLPYLIPKLEDTLNPKEEESKDSDSESNDEKQSTVAKESHMQLNLAGIDLSSYAVAPLPNLTNDLQTKGLSVTYSAVVNGYTKHRKEARELAQFITDINAGSLYEESGKMPCQSGITYSNEIFNQVLGQYKNSISVPKLMDSGDFWLRMEIVLNNIWNGSAVEEQVTSLK